MTELVVSYSQYTVKNTSCLLHLSISGTYQSIKRLLEQDKWAIALDRKLLKLINLLYFILLLNISKRGVVSNM